MRLRLPFVAAGRTVRYTLVAIAAFTLGSVTVVAAGPTISGFVGITDGTNNAKVTANGELSVNVGNFPATQTITGDVNVGNFPTTQAVSGNVAVSNLPLDASGNVRTSGTQTLSGSVAVSNLPATQQIAGNVGDARVTSLLALDDLFPVAGATTVTALHSTAGYTQVRVSAHTAWGSCATPLTIRVFAPASSSTSSANMELGSGTFCNDAAAGIGVTVTDYTAVFDVPGTGLDFSVTVPLAVGVSPHVVIATWGR